MSKKNNKATKRRQHEFDIRREREAELKKTTEMKKRHEKAAAAGLSPTQLLKKVKGIRVRKGKHVKGVKIVDADSKRKALKLLRAEAALRAMDVDELMQAAATTRGPGGRKGSGSKKSKGAASTSGAAEVRNDKDAMME